MLNLNARLWEIAENLHRVELKALERDEHLAEWIRLTEDKQLQSSQLATNGSRREDGRGQPLNAAPWPVTVGSEGSRDRDPEPCTIRMKIRPEAPDDHVAIGALTQRAFDPMPFADGTEAESLNKLRADGDLVLSLVATDGSELIGHVAFSPAFIDGASAGWYGLGPLSVSPDRQRQGIGSALVVQGLEWLRRMNAKGCVLIGDPAYYRRFGFAGDGRLAYRDLAPNLVQWLAFGDLKPSGTVRFSPGLE